MMNQTRRLGWVTFVTLMLLGSLPASAGVCWWGECSEMTNEFRSMELRPQTIALLPARSTLTEDGVFNSEERVGETAGLEDLLADNLEKQFLKRGYIVRRLTFDEIGQDSQLATLLSAANERYDEEYATIVAFKVSSIKYRRYSIGAEGRQLANYLGVDAVAFPRMQIVGASSGSKWMAVVGADDGKAGGINMEFGLVHARTGDIEALFGGVSKSGSGPFGGVSFKKILKKGKKYMADIAKTATKKMPDFDEALKPQKLDEEATELVLYDPIDEESVLDDLDSLLSDE
jgi:hypothetical protein